MAPFINRLALQYRIPENWAGWRQGSSLTREGLASGRHRFCGQPSRDISTAAYKNTRPARARQGRWPRVARDSAHYPGPDTATTGLRGGESSARSSPDSV